MPADDGRRALDRLALVRGPGRADEGRLGGSLLTWTRPRVEARSARSSSSCSRQPACPGWPRRALSGWKLPQTPPGSVGSARLPSDEPSGRTRRRPAISGTDALQLVVLAVRLPAYLRRLLLNLQGVPSFRTRRAVDKTPLIQCTAPKYILGREQQVLRLIFRCMG